MHIWEYATKTCTARILKEHIVEFDTYEEAKNNSDRPIKECKLCFHQKYLQKKTNEDEAMTMVQYAF